MFAESAPGGERRSNRVCSAAEQTAEARLLLGFFDTGSLLPPSAVPYCGDEEYLSACLSMAQDLGRYCVSRACEVVIRHSYVAPKEWGTNLTVIAG